MNNIIVIIINIFCAVVWGWLAYNERQQEGYWNTIAILDVICCSLWVLNASLRIFNALA